MRPSFCTPRADRLGGSIHEYLKGVKIGLPRWTGVLTPWVQDPATPPSDSEDYGIE
jgi:hypothetical protein